MKKFAMILTAMLCLSILLTLSVAEIFAESYYPLVRSDEIAYRNFFGEGRGMTFYDEVLEASKYPIPERLNDAAKSNGTDKHCSEANNNGGIFLFKNAVLTKDANELAVFYGYDMGHGGVVSAKYYVYAAAPGTAENNAMVDGNLVGTLEYDKAAEIDAGIATSHWEDFYDATATGPMTGDISLKAGEYDIYVKIELLGDGVTDSSISAKLADLIFYASETGGPVNTPGTTAAPKTDEPVKTSDIVDPKTGDISLIIPALLFMILPAGFLLINKIKRKREF